MTNILKGLSSVELQQLAKEATKLASDLQKEEPTYKLALLAGVEDHSYNTVRYGDVASYSGEAVVEMANGKKFKAVGHAPQGGADYITRRGYIEFIPLD